MSLDKYSFRENSYALAVFKVLECLCHHSVDGGVSWEIYFAVATLNDCPVDVKSDLRNDIPSREKITYASKLERSPHDQNILLSKDAKLTVKLLSEMWIVYEPLHNSTYDSLPWRRTRPDKTLPSKAFPIHPQWSGTHQAWWKSSSGEKVTGAPRTFKLVQNDSAR